MKYPIRVLLLLLVLCALPSGCGGDPVEQAGFQVGRGALEEAEATLAGVGGRKADALRDRIARLRTEREEVEVEIARLVALAADGDQKAARDGLKRLATRVDDVRARESVDRARSQLSDLMAAELRRREDGAAVARAGTTEFPHDELIPELRDEAELVDSMVERIVGHVRSAADDGDWASARSLLQMAAASAGTHAEDLRTLGRELEARGAADMRALLAEADRVERERGAAAAYELLAGAERRFPDVDAYSALRERLRGAETADSVAAARPEPAPRREPAAPPKAPEPPVSEPGLREPSAPPDVARAEPPSRPEAKPEPAPKSRPEPDPEPASSTSGPDADATEWIVEANRQEEVDALVAALDAWRKAARAVPRGPGREHAEQRAKNLEARLAFRRAAASALELQGESFALLAIESVDDERVVIAGESLRWPQLDATTFERIRLLVEPEGDARTGWIAERLARGDATALHELAASQARGELDAARVASLVAAFRGERAPEEGYAYERGEWVDRGAARRAALAATLEDLGRKLASANESKRDEHLANLVELGADGRETLAEALRKRWSTAYRDLESGSTLDQLERVAAQRAELDTRREEALALIFDEVEYFYPYNPPECPPDRARLYPAVQQRVNALVARVREVWEAPKRASLPKKFRAALGELDWNAARQRELGLAFEPAAELPAWLAGIEPALEELTLHDFARDAEELAARRYDRAVLALNERSFAEYVPAKDYERSVADTLEAEQVRITNRYRLMMGRRALAWNHRLQASSRMHSDWMSRTGKFTHFNDEDPERTTPGDRMRLEGYNSGISENLHQGGAGPQGAHDGWTQSSGHHRNLLMPGHREMASAAGGAFWTQNYGVGTDFLEKLEQWYD